MIIKILIYIYAILTNKKHKNNIFLINNNIDLIDNNINLIDNNDNLKFIDIITEPCQ
jgi:hypothetical protein